MRLTFILIVLIFQQPLTTGAQEIKITLLGTGSPKPSIEQFGPATLIQAGGQNFLFDLDGGQASAYGNLRYHRGKLMSYSYPSSLRSSLQNTEDMKSLHI
ncbi:MAG TPA: hypothetical protein VFG39_00300 [Balneolaceae bacterium]|nr:hypothetical protein [Balneolaceae bacterium]